MEKKTFDIYTKAELKEKYTKDNTRFDVALASHMDKLDKAIKGLTAELDAVKSIAKQVFGNDGGNDVFSTETRVSFLLNMDELIELIGEEKVNELKNKPSTKTYVHW